MNADYYMYSFINYDKLFLNFRHVLTRLMWELKRVIDDSEVMKEDDSLWTPADRVV